MLYFAYGSNLHLAQMARRCPTAQPLGRFQLQGWRLVFRHVADCIEEPGAVCHGGVWRIGPRDEDALDVYEGVRGGLYRKEYIRVKETAHGEREMLIYCMNSIGIMPPACSYLETIRQGYRDFGLPLHAWKALTAAVRESWDDKHPSHIERQRIRRKGHPTLAPRPKDPKQRVPVAKVTVLPPGTAHGLERETIGDLIYAQHNAGPDFTGKAKKSG